MLKKRMYGLAHTCTLKRKTTHTKVDGVVPRNVEESTYADAGESGRETASLPARRAEIEREREREREKERERAR